MFAQQTKESSKRGVTFATSAPSIHYSDSPCSSLLSEEERTGAWYSSSELEQFKTLARDLSRQSCCSCIDGHQQQQQEDATPTGNGDATMEHSTTIRRVSIVRPQHDLAPPVVGNDVESDDNVVLLTPMTSSSLDTNMRGLEGRTSLERKRNKHMAIRAVLEFQRRQKIKLMECWSMSGPEMAITMMLQGRDHLSLVSQKFTTWATEVAIAAGRSDYAQVYLLNDDEPARLFAADHKSTIAPFPIGLFKRSSARSTTDDDTLVRRVRARL